MSPPPFWHFSKNSSNLVAGSFPNYNNDESKNLESESFFEETLESILRFSILQCQKRDKLGLKQVGKRQRYLDV